MAVHVVQGWQRVRLWTVLSQRDSVEARTVRGVLERWMPQISMVLKSGGTAPLDFTLHDEEHAERVAEKMADIIPEDVLPNLSDYELALLLLSAFLHDVGMTPERGKVVAHRRFLLDGNTDALGESERREFQRWLDESGHEFVPPIPSGASRDEAVRTADEILTYYARHRHNDWSEDWIRARLDGESLGTYVGWVEDLIALCRSHHEGYDTLASDRFNPRPVGTPPQVVNLRYLAAVLRVADVLDIDPERTPKAVLNHRDIGPRSLIYWYKDDEITLTVQQGRVAVFARPTRAFVHRAVEETVSGIEAELALCRRLDDVKRFSLAAGLIAELPHRWDLHPYVYRDLQPREGTYEYIDGAFRPNTRRILEMLSGTELYGERFAAIREALQNAFDAVRERVAYQRLRQPNPADPSLETTLGNLHSVQVKLEHVDDRAWLVVSDDGIGMTKSILRDHFLVSGSPRRHQVRDLERRCASAGFTLGRTGQFGLGALSYFMLADRVVIITRRIMEAGDSEMTGWRFESDGVGAFGELRRDTERVQGTELRLRLRPDVIREGHADLNAWMSSLASYVERVLGRIPCRFEILGGIEEQLLQRPPGWTMQRNGCEDRLLEAWPSAFAYEGIPEALLTLEKRRLRETQRSAWAELRSTMVNCLRWEVLEKDLLGGVGRCRLHLPYFDLPVGRSLAFLHFIPVGERMILRGVGDGDMFSPRGAVDFYWKGFTADVYDPESEERQGPLMHLESIGLTLEVDLTASVVGEISVDRGSLALSPVGVKILEVIEAWAYEALWELVRKLDDAPLVALNHSVAGLLIEMETPLFWATRRGTPDDHEIHELTWEELVFPQASTSSRISVGGYEVDGRPVLKDLSSGERKWVSGSPTADQLVLNEQWSGVWDPALIWFTRPSFVRREWPTAQFPPEWLSVCGAVIPSINWFTSSVYWNANHSLLKRLTDQAMQWWASKVEVADDPLSFGDEILSDSSKAAIWLLHFASGGPLEVWEGLRDRDPGFLPTLWTRLFEAEGEGEWQPLAFIGSGDYFKSVRVRILTPDTCLESTTLAAHVPVPSDSWIYHQLHAGLPENLPH